MTTLVTISVVLIVLYFCWPFLKLALQVVFALCALAWTLALGLAFVVLPFLFILWLFH